jgi:NADPH:quinone reductase-like Zn-dependent oxidoreductase
VRIPEGINVDKAAAIKTAWLTSYKAIISFVKTIDKVFIQWRNSRTGTFTIQIAKVLGAYIIATYFTRNIGLVKGLRADVVVNHKITDILEVLAKEGIVFK